MHPALATMILFTRTHFKQTEALQSSIGWILVQNVTKPSSGKEYGRDSSHAFPAGVVSAAYLRILRSHSETRPD